MNNDNLNAQLIVLFNNQDVEINFPVVNAIDLDKTIDFSIEISIMKELEENNDEL